MMASATAFSKGMDASRARVLGPCRRSVQRVGAALLALGGKSEAGRPFRPPLSTALDR